MQAKARDASPRGIPYPEYMLRILFQLFYPAVKVAVDFHYPLDTVKDMMTLALWRQAREKHATINLISLIFGKSTRTVKALSARFNRGGFFEETETNLMRRIEDILLDGPLTLDDLADRLPHCNEFDSTRLAVKALLEEGRIEELPRRPGQPVRYRAVAHHHDLYCDGDWEARIDALGEHLEVITETVRQRFLGDAPDHAAARTFTFRARPEEMARFREELFEFIRSRYREMEERSAGDETSRVFAVYAGSAMLHDDDD